MAKKKDRSTDSYLPSYFAVEIDGIQQGKFFKCSGIEAETSVFEVEEGGLNTTTHKFLGRTRFPNIVLENGLSENSDIFNWYQTVAMTNDPIERKDGSIVLYNPGGEEVKRWNFYRGIPFRYVGPTLDRAGLGTAIERIEIAHEGLELG
jgi:phage tail-like protein